MDIAELTVGGQYVAWVSEAEPETLQGTPETGWVVTVVEINPSLEPYGLPEDVVVVDPVLVNVGEATVIKFQSVGDMVEMLAVTGRQVPALRPDTSPNLQVIRERPSIMPAAMIRMPLAEWAESHLPATAGAAMG